MDMQAEVRVLQDLAKLGQFFQTPREDDTGQKEGRAVFFERAIHQPTGGNVAGRFGGKAGKDASKNLGWKDSEDVLVLSIR